MSWVQRRHNQTAVYWGGPTPGEAGNTTFDTAVELSVRWENKVELFMDPQGQEAKSKALVYLGQDVVNGGYLYLGDEDDLDSDHSDPTIISGAKPIRQFMKTPRLVRSTDFERKAFL